VAEVALEAQGIDAFGLDEVDRKVLRVILEQYRGGPVGLEALAATLNEEVDTLAEVVEPYLLKAGLLRRTPRGREATQMAAEHLGVIPKRLL
jgi:Holliday junction DNA helicase RuvB